MIFLSTLLNHAIYDSDQHRVGSIRDICVELNETFPVVTALIIHSTAMTNGLNNNQQLIVPWQQVQSIEEEPIQLTVPRGEITPYIPGQDEILLKRDILDKQIVDTQGFRVVKVNDLKLAQIKHTARLVGVDIGMSGLLRRMGWQKAVDMVGRITPLQLTERTITWNYVEPIKVISNTTGQLAAVGAGNSNAINAVGTAGVIPQVQLNISHNKLTELHPADIADILEQLDIEDAGAVLENMDDETAADALNEVETPRQYELLGELDPERASDLLERLSPDDAADILADIPAEEAERLLNLMPLSESRPIRELLRYESETAGGIMTSEVLAQHQDATVEQVLVYLRQHSAHLDMVYYLYIIDEERHLIGVVSLRQLITNEPATQMAALMDHDVISVRVNTDQEEVARVIAKYDLLGIPVVDEEDHLLGVVTVDDVIDVIHEEQAEDISEITGTDVEANEEHDGSWWSSSLTRSSWLLVNVAAGFVIALMLTNIFHAFFSASTALVLINGLLPALTARIALNSLFCLLPMLLLTTGTAGSQALGIVGWELRTKRGRDLYKGVWRELLHGTTGGILTTIIVGLLTWALFSSLTLGVIVGLGFGVTLLIAALCGMALPNILHRLHLRGSLISAPMLNPVIAVISLSIFLSISVSLLNNAIR
jgi:Mg2+ transporter (mgtE)